MESSSDWHLEILKVAKDEPASPELIRGSLVQQEVAWNDHEWLIDHCFAYCYGSVSQIQENDLAGAQAPRPSSPEAGYTQVHFDAARRRRRSILHDISFSATIIAIYVSQESPI